MLSLGTGGEGLSQYMRLDILNLNLILFVLKYVKKRNNHISYLVAGGGAGSQSQFSISLLNFLAKSSEKCAIY